MLGDTKQKTLQELRESKGSCEPDDRAAHRDPHTVGEHQIAHVLRLSAESETNPKFTRTLLNGVRHHAENTDGSQQDRGAANARPIEVDYTLPAESDLAHSLARVS